MLVHISNHHFATWSWDHNQDLWSTWICWLSISDCCTPSTYTPSTSICYYLIYLYISSPLPPAQSPLAMNPPSAIASPRNISGLPDRDRAFAEYLADNVFTWQIEWPPLWLPVRLGSIPTTRSSDEAWPSFDNHDPKSRAYLFRIVESHLLDDWRSGSSPSSYAEI